MPTRSTAGDVAERAMRTTLLALSHRKSLGRLATRVPVTRPMVRRFVAGETLEEVLPAIERLRDAGMGTTVDVLGESVTAEEDARAAAGRYLDVLDALAAGGLDRNVSLKPSQMGLGIAPALARENIAAIVTRAWKRAPSSASTWRTTPRPMPPWSSGGSCARRAGRTVVPTSGW